MTVISGREDYKDYDSWQGIKRVYPAPQTTFEVRGEREGAGTNSAPRHHREKRKKTLKDLQKLFQNYLRQGLNQNWDPYGPKKAKNVRLSKKWTSLYKQGEQQDVNCVYTCRCASRGGVPPVRNPGGHLPKIFVSLRFLLKIFYEIIFW